MVNVYMFIREMTVPRPVHLDCTVLTALQPATATTWHPVPRSTAPAYVKKVLYNLLSFFLSSFLVLKDPMKLKYSCWQNSLLAHIGTLKLVAFLFKEHIKDGWLYRFLPSQMLFEMRMLLPLIPAATKWAILGPVIKNFSCSSAHYCTFQR